MAKELKVHRVDGDDGTVLIWLREATGEEERSDLPGSMHVVALDIGEYFDLLPQLVEAGLGAIKGATDKTWKLMLAAAKAKEAAEERSQQQAERDELHRRERRAIEQQKPPEPPVQF